MQGQAILPCTPGSAGTVRKVLRRSVRAGTPRGGHTVWKSGKRQWRNIAYAFKDRKELDGEKIWTRETDDAVISA